MSQMCGCSPCVFPYISRCHNIIAEVASQLMPWDIGEQRGSWDRGCHASRRGGGRGSRGTGRRGLRPCRNTLTNRGFLQAVAHHDKCVKAESSIYHKLWSERCRLQQSTMIDVFSQSKQYPISYS